MIVTILIAVFLILPSLVTVAVFFLSSRPKPTTKYIPDYTKIGGSHDD